MVTDEWLIIPKAAKAADLSAPQIRRLCQRGQLDCQKVGRDWIVSRASLLTYLRKWDANAELREIEEGSASSE